MKTLAQLEPSLPWNFNCQFRNLYGEVFYHIITWHHNPEDHKLNGNLFTSVFQYVKEYCHTEFSGYAREILRLE
jgi:hypothetical protein